MNGIFGVAEDGKAPRQYPWLTICYAGTYFWCLSCTYILLLYGAQFQVSEGHQWLVSFIVSLLMDMFVNEPATLLILAVLLSAYEVYKRSSKKRRNIRSHGT